MKKIHKYLVTVALLFSVISCQSNNQSSDMIITNAKIWTGNESQPLAEAMAVSGDTIIAVGSNPINILEELWSATYNKINPEPTFPSDAPNKTIDYVMHYPAGRWETVETKVICDSIASDHCAYLVTLKLLKD